MGDSLKGSSNKTYHIMEGEDKWGFFFFTDKRSVHIVEGKACMSLK